MRTEKCLDRIRLKIPNGPNDGPVELFVGLYIQRRGKDTFFVHFATAPGIRRAEGVKELAELLLLAHRAGWFQCEFPETMPSRETLPAGAIVH